MPKKAITSRTINVKISVDWRDDHSVALDLPIPEELFQELTMAGLFGELTVALEGLGVEDVRDLVAEAQPEDVAEAVAELESADPSVSGTLVSDFSWDELRAAEGKKAKR